MTSAPYFYTLTHLHFYTVQCLPPHRRYRRNRNHGEQHVLKELIARFPTQGGFHCFVVGLDAIPGIRSIDLKAVGNDEEHGQQHQDDHCGGQQAERNSNGHGNEKLRLQVEHMLGMAALERGELPMDKREVDMHQLIHDALKTMSMK